MAGKVLKARQVDSHAKLLAEFLTQIDDGAVDDEVVPVDRESLRRLLDVSSKLLDERRGFDGRLAHARSHDDRLQRETSLCQRRLDRTQKSYAGVRSLLTDVGTRLASAESVMRSLASYLGVGGYNAPAVFADVFERKIRDGIDALVRVEVGRALADERESAALLEEQTTKEET